MPNNKINSAVVNSFKFLSNLQDNQTNDPNYIPENMQPFVNSFIRNGRKKFDLLDKQMGNLDKSSDEYIGAEREIEKIAKSFITLKSQVDKFKTSQGSFKNLVPNINQGTKAENMHINTVIFGEQMDEFIIGEDGRMNFGIKGTPQKHYKLDTLQDDFPLVTEPFNSKSYVYEKYEETQLNRDMGKPFDEVTEYNKILYNIKQGGNSEVIGLAYTDLVGDSSTESFAEMWESGLADQSLYYKPNTASSYSPGEKLPKDSEWMKDEANADMLSEIMAKHLTNTMGAVSGTKPAVTIHDEKQFGDVFGGVTDSPPHKAQHWLDDKPVKKVDLPEVAVSDDKIDREVDGYLKPDKEEKLSDKVKTMPTRLFDRHMKRLDDQLKKSKKKDKKSKKEWKEFLNKLPGGDYYSYVKQMRNWRKSKLTPAELIKKYS
tara:strand:- start:50 stop:1339 length:1290 start_codon:yes stop_codon:yes gene_type:complete